MTENNLYLLFGAISIGIFLLAPIIHYFKKRKKRGEM